ncbi:KIF21 [Mytilus coruscus]|uniref:KIF21 n=1 Tax=Mytilus coruscus TaxID=42192 RepID=A0A6J8BWK2_MYTCO|nr:KIF21 [Mytilus coruscus]
MHGPVHPSTSGSPFPEQSENSASATKQDTYVDFIGLYADSSELSSDADKTCSLIPETETEDTKKDSDNTLDEQTMETESLPGPSGLCSTKEKHEIEDVTETVETISVSLVTTRICLGDDCYQKGGSMSFPRPYIMTPEMDWKLFFEGQRRNTGAWPR